MDQIIQIAFNINDLEADEGNKVIFNISLEKLVITLIKTINKMATDNNNPVRMYASNANTALALLLQALSASDEETPAASIVVKEKRRHSGFGKRPSDAELLRHKANGIPQGDLAKLYGVTKSAISNWYCDIKNKRKPK